MSLLSSSSSESRWRGYNYYKQKRVQNLEPLGGLRFQAAVSGTRKTPYTTIIDLNHVRQSSCTCPHASGRQIICKHMVAAFFTAFPDEAEKYYKDMQRQQDYQEQLYDKLIKYVRGLKKNEAQEMLLEVLETGPEWQWGRFIRDHIE